MSGNVLANYSAIYKRTEQNKLSKQKCSNLYIVVVIIVREIIQTFHILRLCLALDNHFMDFFLSGFGDPYLLD
jgi:hypothetical protein